MAKTGASTLGGLDRFAISLPIIGNVLGGIRALGTGRSSADQAGTVFGRNLTDMRGRGVPATERLRTVAENAASAEWPSWLAESAKLRQVLWELEDELHQPRGSIVSAPAAVLSRVTSSGTPPLLAGLGGGLGVGGASVGGSGMLVLAAVAVLLFLAARRG